jgi:hypothetical protein
LKLLACKLEAEMLLKDRDKNEGWLTQVRIEGNSEGEASEGCNAQGTA